MLESNFNINCFFLFIFYIKNDATKVLARFDLDKAWREFVFAFGIPGSLFIISFISLCIITRSVKVGDDAKMRCKYCIDENSDIDDDIDELANKCVQQLNAIEEAVNEHDLAIEQPPGTSTSKVSYLSLFPILSVSVDQKPMMIFNIYIHTYSHNSNFNQSRRHRVTNRKPQQAEPHSMN